MYIPGTLDLPNAQLPQPKSQSLKTIGRVFERLVLGLTIDKQCYIHVQLGEVYPEDWFGHGISR